MTAAPAPSGVGAEPHYERVTPPPPAPPQPPGHPPRTRRVLLAIAAVWALVLAIAGISYSFHGRPTAREQTTVASARPTVDTAIVNATRAAGSAAVPAVFGFEKVADCKVTPIRGGARYARELWLFVPADGTGPLLDRLAAGLPRSYHAKVLHAAHTLAADAGDFVALDAAVLAPGLVSVKADTGCRPVGPEPAADPTTTPGVDPLGVSGTWRLHTLPCGLRTTTVTGSAARPLSGLPRSGDARSAPVIATDDVYADRTGLAAYRDGSLVTLAATMGTC